jgi:hypothetical protein
MPARPLPSRACPLAAAWLTLTLAACGEEAPEPVHFAPVQSELFADGGTLTDAWADFDLDGDPDRFVGFDGTASRLYRNDRTGGFVDVAAEVGLVVERSVRTSAWGDFDRDGDPDLLLGFAGDAPVTALFRNDREGGFTNVAAAVGLEVATGATRQAAWIDQDGDGDLDLFLAMRDGPNRLFENRGDNGFVDIAPDVGLDDPRRSVGGSWFDTGDGGLDLIVANMNGDANALYLAGPEGFTEAVQHEAVRNGGRALGDEAQGTVRPCVVDYDADGDFDLFFANYGSNGLAERTPVGWAPVAADVALDIEGRYDTCAWGDFDHDGTIDLYVNGTVGGNTHWRDWLMRREGTDAFMDVTPADILAEHASHGASWVDFDMDGDLDLALAGAAADGTHHLYRNLLRPEYAWHSLQVRVVDEAGHATRPGAEVRIYAAGTDRIMGARLVDSGSGYDAQSDLPVHFGIPGGQPVDVRVTVVLGRDRRSVTVQNVDPREHQGAPLVIRVGPVEPTGR